MLEIIPAVDILGGKVVRLMHGDYNRVTVYSDDPVAQCLAWMNQGAERVHVVDLEGARSGRPDQAMWRRLADAGVLFQIGGGIRTVEAAETALAVGAERVVLGTAAVWDPQILGRVSEPERVVAAVDVRGDRASGEGWLDRGRELESVLADLAEVGVLRLLVTGIEKDGTMEGPSTAPLDAALEGGRFEIIASGGVGELADFDLIAGLGCEAVVVGRALYEGRFDVRRAIEYVRGSRR